jgi:hypothetical protein
MAAAEQNGYAGAHGAALARATIRSGLRNGLRDPHPLPDFTSRHATPKPAPHREPSAGRPARGQVGPRRAAPDHPRPSPDASAPASAKARRAAASARIVSAVLRAAGYRASSRDRRAAYGPEGYRIQDRGGGIRIEHVAIAEDIRGVAAWDRMAQMLGRYEVTLRRAGFTVTRPTPGSLAVTRPSPPAASGAPTATGHGRRMQANRAAVAANEAYRAGNLDLARQLTGQAAELDPSRADLWQRHREEIAAKRLLLSAKKADAEGDHPRARKLTDDAQRLDPRLRQPWDRQLSKHPAAQRAPARTRQPGAARTTPATAPTTSAKRGTSREPWNRQQSAPRSEPPHPSPAPAPGGARTARPPSASPTAEPGHREQQRTDAHPREAEAGGRPSAKQTEHPQTAAETSPPGAAAHTRAPEPGTSPALSPNRSSRAPATPPPQTPSADWRDTVIETGRQTWQPRVVQPYTPFPTPPQVNGPEIGG